MESELIGVMATIRESIRFNTSAKFAPVAGAANNECHCSYEAMADVGVDLRQELY